MSSTLYAGGGKKSLMCFRRSKNSNLASFLHGKNHIQTLNLSLTCTPGLIISTRDKPIIFTQIQKQNKMTKQFMTLRSACARATSSSGEDHLSENNFLFWQSSATSASKMMPGNYTGASAVSHCERIRGEKRRGCSRRKDSSYWASAADLQTSVSRLHGASLIAGPWQTSTNTEPLTSGLQFKSGLRLRFHYHYNCAKSKLNPANA